MEDLRETLCQLLFIIIQSELLEARLENTKYYQLVCDRSELLGKDFEETPRAKGHPILDQLKDEIKDCIQFLEANGIKSKVADKIDVI